MGADTDRQIARINDLTRAGRGNWFGLLAYLAFTLVTVLGVSDADFFIDSRQTQLPLIGVSIPTFSFFLFAPILGAALHVYLHLLIRKATEALAEPAPVLRGRPLEHALQPWLLNDLVLRARRDGAATRRPLDWLAGVTAMLLIWWAAPFVLALMWIRSLPAHDEGLSLLIALCLVFTLYASLQSWVKMLADIRRPRLAGAAASGGVFAVSALIWVGLSALTILSTEGGIDSLTGETRPDWAGDPLLRPALAALAARDLPGWLREDRLLARADLAGVVFASLPPDQSNRAMAKSNFRQGWCARNGMDFNICGPADDKPDHLYVTRSYWCQSNGLPSLDDCRRRFGDLEAGFEREWTEFRRETLKALEKPSLAGRDLRNANLRNAEMPGINLSRARLEGADLSNARLEGADLREANLARVYAHELNARVANFEYADLSTAELTRADLAGTNLANARLTGARAFDADLRFANLLYIRAEGITLHSADLRGSNLRHALLEGAHLQGADLRGADLRELSARAADWDGARLGPSPAHRADLRGAKHLEQSSVSTLLGDERTLLPDTPDHQTGAPFSLCSCWRSPPTDMDLLETSIRLHDLMSVEARGWICEPGQVPRKTGTPWPAETDAPWTSDESSSSWKRDQRVGAPCPPEPFATRTEP